jgi:hypothetical protein
MLSLEHGGGIRLGQTYHRARASIRPGSLRFLASVALT